MENAEVNVAGLPVAGLRSVALLILTFSPLIANVQRADAQMQQEVPYVTRFVAGAHGEYAQPRDEFRENVNHGWGGGGFVRYDLDRRGIVSLRLGINYSAYGHETKRVPLSGTVGGRILVDVSTTNSLFAVGIGPQITVPVGSLRPWASVGFSGVFFSTGSSVSGTDYDDEPIASTTNYSDGTGALVFGGGILIPVGRMVSIDFGARYHHGGHASYLKEGSIVDNPDGSITITPLESRTPFVLYSVGVSVRLWGKGNGPCPRALCW
jgi:hypothetical protein